MPMWMLACRFLAARQFEVAPARRARTDEDRVVALRQQGLHRSMRSPAAEIDAQLQDVAGLLVDDFFGQAEARESASGSCRRPWRLASNTVTS
jgi:hypothetical protein